MEQFCTRGGEANLRGSLFSFFRLSETNGRVYGRQLQVPRRALCLNRQGSWADLGTSLRFQDSHDLLSAKSDVIMELYQILVKFVVLGSALAQKK